MSEVIKIIFHVLHVALYIAKYCDMKVVLIQTNLKKNNKNDIGNKLIYYQ